METTKLNTRKIIEIIFLVIVNLFFSIPIMYFITEAMMHAPGAGDKDIDILLTDLGWNMLVFFPIRNLFFIITYWYGKKFVPHIWQILNNILTKPIYCIGAILILFGLDCLTYLIGIESFEGVDFYEFVSLGGATGALLYFLIIQKISDVTASNLSLDEKTIKQLKPLMLMFAYPVFPIAIITIIYFIFSLTI